MQTLIDERALSKLRWRCRRGLLENDLFVERFFAVRADGVTTRQAEGLSALMDLADNDLLDLLLRRTEPQGELRRDDVMEVIKELATGGMTMLVVTHEMQFAHDIASRVWVIDKGTIAEDGPPSQVVDDPQTSVAREFFARLRSARR